MTGERLEEAANNEAAGGSSILVGHCDLDQTRVLAPLISPVAAAQQFFSDFISDLN